MSASPREERGFANARIAKLHHLAMQKRNRAVRGTVRGNNRPQKAVLLSTVLAASPQYFDNLKVACVEKYLTQIDELPGQYQTAEVVYLSQNSLRSLAGIDQFPNLRVLNASDNLIDDVSDLQVLAACPALQVASFERNPLAYLPNYRSKVMQLLPRLQMLDGQGISGQDRQRAGAALKQEAACMAVMLSNACMVHKLARTAELLQLHTELRRALFGSSSVLAKSILPASIPLDLLKFLRLWDYEGGLSPGDRRIINDALTREVVRVHRQLQHAATQLKGPAQLPALQAWDAAFSQVMLAQQRTIIQLVEVVNVLHDEAAKLVAALTRGSTGTNKQGKHGQQQPEQAQQQLADEREGLIVDLRDAALELAGVLASKVQLVLEDGTVVSSSSMPPSPQHHLPLQQQSDGRFLLPQQHQHSSGPHQMVQQLPQLPSPQQQQQQQQQFAQQPATPVMHVAELQLQQPQDECNTALQLEPQQQQQLPARLPMSLQEQQLPSFPLSPPQLKQQQEQDHQQPSAGKLSGRPARRSSGIDQLRLRPAKHSPQTASHGGTAAPAAKLSPVRTRLSSQSSGNSTNTPSVRAPAVMLSELSATDGQQQLSPGDSPNGRAQLRPLSPTARRLLQCATLVQQSQHWQGQHMQDSTSAEAHGSAASTQTVPDAAGAAEFAVPAGPGSPGLVLPFSSPAKLSADAAAIVQYDTYTVQAADGAQQQQWRQVSQSLPSSPVHRQQQQQQTVQALSRSHSGSLLHFPADLDQLSQTGVIYERIERFTPVGTAGLSPGSPAAVAAANLAAACAAQASSSVALVTVDNTAALSRPDAVLGTSDLTLQKLDLQQQQQQQLATTEQLNAALLQAAWQQQQHQQGLVQQQQMHAGSDPNSPNTEDSAYYTVNSAAPSSVRASASLLQAMAAAEAPASAAGAMPCSTVALPQDHEQDAHVTAAAMVAVAEANARQLFAVEGVPGSCTFFSPYVLQRPAPSSSSTAAAEAAAAAALTSDAGATTGEGSVGASQTAASDSQHAVFTFNPSHAASSSEGGSYFLPAAASQAGRASAGTMRDRAGSSALAVAGEELSFAMTASAESSPESCCETAAQLLGQQACQRQQILGLNSQQQQSLPHQQWQGSQQQINQQLQNQLLWSLLSSTEDPVEVLPLQCSPSHGSHTGAATSANTSVDPSSTAALMGAPPSPKHAASPAALLPGSPRSSITGQAGTPAATSEVTAEQKPAPAIVASSASTAAAPVAALIAVQRPLLAVIPELTSPRSSMGIVASPVIPSNCYSRTGGSLASSVGLSPVRQRLFESVAVSSSMDVNGGNSMGFSSLSGAVDGQQLAAQAAVPQASGAAQTEGQDTQQAYLQAQQLQLKQQLALDQLLQVPSAAASAIIPASATGSNSPGPHSPGPSGKRLTLEDWNIQVHPQVMARLQGNAVLPQQMQQKQQQLAVQRQLPQLEHCQQQGPTVMTRARSVESSLSGISLIGNLPSAAPSSRTVAVSAAATAGAGSASNSVPTSSAPGSLGLLHQSSAPKHAAALQQRVLDQRVADAAAAAIAAASTAAISTAGSGVSGSAGTASSGQGVTAVTVAPSESETALDVRAAAAAATAAGAMSTAAQSTAGSKLTSSSGPTSGGQTALHNALLAALQPSLTADSMIGIDSGQAANTTSPRSSIAWQPSSPSVQGPLIGEALVVPAAAAAAAGAVSPRASMAWQAPQHMPSAAAADQRRPQGNVHMSWHALEQLCGTSASAIAQTAAESLSPKASSAWQASLQAPPAAAAAAPTEPKAAGPLNPQASIGQQPVQPQGQVPPAAAGAVSPHRSMRVELHSSSSPGPVAVTAAELSSPRASLSVPPARLSVQGAAGAVGSGGISEAAKISMANACGATEHILQATHLATDTCMSPRGASSSTAASQATAAVAAAVAAASRSSIGAELARPACQDTASVTPVVQATPAAAITAQLSGRRLDAVEAAAVGRPKSPGERRAELLVELQARLATLALEKAALEKQLTLDKGHIQELQQKVELSAQQEAVLPQLQANLVAAQQLLQEIGGLAAQRAQQNEQLKAQIKQVQAQMAAEAAERQRATAAENLARFSLCRRMLAHYKDAAEASKTWRARKANAALHSQQALQRRGLRAWHTAAVCSRQVEVFRLKQHRRVLRDVLQAWLHLVLLQRLASAQTTAAMAHWAARSCRRVLTHWRFYTYQIKQLGIEPPSSPSSCSICSDSSPQQTQQQQHSKVSGQLSPRTADHRRYCRSGSSVFSSSGDRNVLSAAKHSSDWHGRHSTAAAEAAELKEKLQRARLPKSLTDKLPCSSGMLDSHSSRQNSMAARCQTTAAASTSFTARLQSGSLRSLSARLSPVLSPRDAKQLSRTTGISSSDSEISVVGETVRVMQSMETASTAAVAAAWADVAEGKQASLQTGKQHGDSIIETVQSPRDSQLQQQQSPARCSLGTTISRKTLNTATHLATMASTLEFRPSRAQAGVEDTTTACMLQRAERASQLSRFNSPMRPSRKSATWFDSSAFAGTVEQQAEQGDRQAAHRTSSKCRGAKAALASCATAARAAGLSAAGCQSSEHARLSAGSLSKSAFSRQQSLSLSAATTSGLVSSKVPVEVQLSFLSAARAQRLWRRRMLLKAWTRWQQLLQIQSEYEGRLAAAGSRYNRHVQHKAFAAWQQYLVRRQYKRDNPNGGADPVKLHIARQHRQLKELAVKCRILQSWWLLMHRAAAARLNATNLAAEKQRRMQRQVLQAFQQHVHSSFAVKLMLQKADQLYMQRQLRRCWLTWKQAVLNARAEAAGKMQQSQQLLSDVVLRWQRVSAAVTAADELSRRLQQLQGRRELRILAHTLSQWKLFKVKSSKERQDAELEQLQQHLQVLQDQKQQEQQEVVGMTELQQQLLGLQQQLEAALASKADLEQVVKQQQQELQQQSDSHKQQLMQLKTEHNAAATVMQEQLAEAASTADEATQQLQQLQLQQANQQLQQQLKEKELEFKLQQHQQRQQQLEGREDEITQQLAASKAQTKELASQLKRCSEKLNQQTKTVQALKCTLETAQEQLAVASSASRDQNLNLTQQSFALEKERLRSQQLLHSEQATVVKLQQQVQRLEQQLQEQQCLADAAATQHQVELGRMAEQLAVKDQAMKQLQSALGALQGKLADQQAKVLVEVAQLRSGWSQAKAIIKQQRRTIKHQDLQLQLAMNCAAPHGLGQFREQPSLKQQQQQGAEVSGQGTWGSDGVGSSNQYPITSFVLQSQQQQPILTTEVTPAASMTTAAVARSAAAAAPCVPGSLAWAARRGQRGLAGHGDSRATGLLHSSSILAALQQQLDCLQEQEQDLQQQKDGLEAIHVVGMADAKSSKSKGETNRACDGTSNAQQCCMAAAAQSAVHAAELLGCTDEILRHIRGD